MIRALPVVFDFSEIGKMMLPKNFKENQSSTELHAIILQSSPILWNP